MTDTFTEDYNKVKDIGTAIQNDLKTRGNMDITQNTIKVCNIIYYTYLTFLFKLISIIVLIK